MTSKVANGAIDKITGFFKKAEEVIDIVIGTAVKADDVVYRQQVPADRWHFDYKADFKTTKEELQARGWAVFYTLEGTIRVAAEAIRILIAKYVSNTQEGVDKLETILNTQIRSLKYTAWAIIDPIGQKRNTQEEFKKGHFPVGCAQDDFHWGDQYEGIMTIPSFPFEYNWKLKA